MSSRRGSADGPAERRINRLVLLTRIGLVVVLVAAWEGAPIVFDMNTLVLPRFSTVIVAAIDILGNTGPLFRHVRVTLWEIIAAFTLGGSVGIAVGTLIGVNRRIREWAMPVLNALFAVPIVAIIPLFLVMFGIGSPSKIAFGAIYAVFPTMFGTVSGIASIDSIHLEVADAYGVRGTRRFMWIIMRGAARQIAAGLQVGMAAAVIAVIAVQMFGALAGVGMMNTAALARGSIHSPRSALDSSLRSQVSASTLR